MSEKRSTTIPQHQWTHDGTEVLIVRQCRPDGSSSHGYRYPLTVGAIVEAPDWNPVPVCGGGLHGWPWGFCLGDGADPDWLTTWLVIGAVPADVVDLAGKVKIRAGTVRCVGGWWDAMQYVRAGQMAWIAHAVSRSTGRRAGQMAWIAHAVSRSTGNRAVSSSTGFRALSSSTGDGSVAVVTGREGRAQAGPYGVIALAWWHAAAQRMEMRCARVVDGHDGTLKPHTWYALDADGQFVEVRHA